MQQFDPSPFLRGVLPSVSWNEGSRLPSLQIRKLPADTVAAARVPAGVHLALCGSARAVDLTVATGPATSVPAPGLADGLTVVTSTGASHVPVPGGVCSVRVSGPAGDMMRIYLPEEREMRIEALVPVGGTLESPPRGPRWVVYGDSITQGWSVSRAGLAWPSLVAQDLGLDCVNLGFAGAARGEMLVADVVAGSRAAAVAIAWGTNAWSSLPTDESQIAETMRLFIVTVRQGLPEVPIVVVSPIVRPGAENAPNRFGATHAGLRRALEQAVLSFREQSQDENLLLVEGLGLVDATCLADGIHPDDAGHARLAAGVRDHVAAGLIS